MSKIIQKTIFVLIIAVTAFWGANGGTKTVNAAERWLTRETVTVTDNGCDFLAYLSEDGKESWIYQIKMNKDGLKKLIFPTRIKNAPVTRIGYGSELYEEDADCWYSIFHTALEPWHDCYENDVEWSDSIMSIVFPKTLTQIEGGAFCGFKSLKKAEIPNGVKELPPFTFAACKKMTEVKLPAQLTTINANAFDKSRKISKFRISSKSKKYKAANGFLLSKNEKKLIWTAPALKTVSIPEGVKQVTENALVSSKAEKIVIPKSVREIDNEALTGKDIEKIELKKGNKVYQIDRGNIFKKSNKKLVAILVKNGKAKISSKVKILDKGISVMGAYFIDRVDIPKSVKQVKNGWLFFKKYEDPNIKIYFHGTKPPKVASKGAGYLALPIAYKVYVPKKAKDAYIKWAKNRDGFLSWSNLKTF